MEHTFDKDYWENHWQESRGETAPNPYLERELTGLRPGTALDAGCGEGAEALWLAAHGWDVTGSDISAAALKRAAERASNHPIPPDRLRWVEADLSVWAPAGQYDLVTTHYAHSSIPQLDFYGRLAEWVAPGGTLLIVGHLHHDQHGHDQHGHDQHGHSDNHTEGHLHPPPEASATAATITALLDPTTWSVVTADETRRTVVRPSRTVELHDFVVRAVRNA